METKTAATERADFGNTMNSFACEEYGLLEILFRRNAFYLIGNRRNRMLGLHTCFQHLHGHSPWNIGHVAD